MAGNRTEISLLVPKLCLGTHLGAKLGLANIIFIFYG